MRHSVSFRTTSAAKAESEVDPLDRRATYSFASASMTRFQDISKHYKAQSFDTDDDDDAFDPQERQSDSGDEENEVDQIGRSEVMEEIEEAWERTKQHKLPQKNQELSLHHLSLDVAGVDYLIQKAHKSMQQQQSQAKGEASVQGCIEKVELHACSFADTQAAFGLIRFLQMLGPNLKEVFLVDTFTHTNDYLLDERAISLLRGLPHVQFLERLAVDKAHLKGRGVGQLLQHVFLKAPHVQVMRFHDCHIDDAMLHPFCQGLQFHPVGLRHLDLEAWYMDDSQLAQLVQALVNSRSRGTLQYWDVSKSDLTFESLPTLALLLQHMRALQELVLQDCPHLWAHVTPKSPGLWKFTQALSQNATQLKELRLGESPHMSDQVAAALVDATQSHPHLHTLHMGDNHVDIVSGGWFSSSNSEQDGDNSNKGAFMSTPSKNSILRGDHEARFVV